MPFARTFAKIQRTKNSNKKSSKKEKKRGGMCQGQLKEDEKGENEREQMGKSKQN